MYFKKGEKKIHPYFPLAFRMQTLIFIRSVRVSINNALSNSCMLGNTLNFKASYNYWIKEIAIKSEHTSSRNSFQLKLYVKRFFFFFFFKKHHHKDSKSNR